MLHFERQEEVMKKTNFKIEKQSPIIIEEEQSKI